VGIQQRQAGEDRMTIPRQFPQFPKRILFVHRLGQNFTIQYDYGVASEVNSMTVRFDRFHLLAGQIHGQHFRRQFRANVLVHRGDDDFAS